MGLERYHHCQKVGCQNVLQGWQVAWALRKFEQQHCSTECFKSDWRSLGLCCEKAQLINCVALSPGRVQIMVHATVARTTRDHPSRLTKKGHEILF